MVDETLNSNNQPFFFPFPFTDSLGRVCVEFNSYMHEKLSFLIDYSLVPEVDQNVYDT